jgi:uncharacterized protein YdaU (DUF1376 family)
MLRISTNAGELVHANNKAVNPCPKYEGQKMSKAPAMPMYWDAYLADTTHLTTEEHGAYMLLIAAMWRRNGSVPNDDKDNARILGMTPAKWRKVKARLGATISGFRVDSDAITQEKLLKTWKNTQEKIAKNALNGAKGGRAAASKNNDLGQANATISVKPNPTIPEPEPEPEPNIVKRDTNVSPKKRATRIPDDWVLSKELGEWALDEGHTKEQIRFEADQFRDYWIGVGGQRGTKLDWAATWRNWIRRNGKQNGTRTNNEQAARADTDAFIKQNDEATRIAIARRTGRS